MRLEYLEYETLTILSCLRPSTFLSTVRISPFTKLFFAVFHTHPIFQPFLCLSTLICQLVAFSPTRPLYTDSKQRQMTKPFAVVIY